MGRHEGPEHVNVNRDDRPRFAFSLYMVFAAKDACFMRMSGAVNFHSYFD